MFFRFICYNGKFQFSVLLCLSLALIYTNSYGIFLRRHLSGISEAETPEPSNTRREIIDTLDFSSWREQKSAQF